MVSIDIKDIKKWGFLGVLMLQGIVFAGITLTSNTVGSDRKDSFAKASQIVAEERDYSEDETTDIQAKNMDMMTEISSEKQEVEKLNEPEIRISWQPVGDEYFRDALFIGDSRTVGLAAYSELRDVAVFYCNTGLTVKKALNKPIVDDETIEEALKSNDFKKIYINLGINEVGTGTAESFAEQYGSLVDDLKILEPDAIIYIQSIMRVTTAKSNKKEYGITNDIIDERNEALRALADDETVFYLDINPPLCDEEGGLNPEYTQDGVHMKANYYNLWSDYLKENAVVREILE